MSLLGLIGVGVAAFVATNLDDMIVLLVFLADPIHHAGAIVLGQFLGFTAIVALSFSAALAARLISPAWIGLLGLIPLAMGLYRVIRLARPPDAAAAPRLAHWQTLTVAGVTLANGGDNIGLYAPLFAAGTRAGNAALILVLYLMLALWCRMAWLLARHPLVATRIQRSGRVLVPLLYIALGVWVLSKLHLPPV
jgi:cadmium resistance protein CadD (predicted permease)